MQVEVNGQSRLLQLECPSGEDRLCQGKPASPGPAAPSRSYWGIEIKAEAFFFFFPLNQEQSRIIATPITNRNYHLLKACSPLTFHFVHGLHL